HAHGPDRPFRTRPARRRKERCALGNGPCVQNRNRVLRHPTQQRTGDAESFSQLMFSSKELTMFAFEAGQPGQPQANEKKGDPLGALYWLCVIHSNCIIVFLRRGFGREALGMRGLLALVLLLLCLGGEPLMILWI